MNIKTVTIEIAIQMYEEGKLCLIINDGCVKGVEMKREEENTICQK